MLEENRQAYDLMTQSIEKNQKEFDHILQEYIRFGTVYYSVSNRMKRDADILRFISKRKIKKVLRKYNRIVYSFPNRDLITIGVTGEIHSAEWIKEFNAFEILIISSLVEDSNVLEFLSKIIPGIRKKLEVLKPSIDVGVFFRSLIEKETKPVELKFDTEGKYSIVSHSNPISYLETNKE